VIHLGTFLGLRDRLQIEVCPLSAIGVSPFLKENP